MLNKKSSVNIRCWQGYGETGLLMHCWWEYTMVQPLWKTGWQFLKKQTNKQARLATSIWTRILLLYICPRNKNIFTSKWNTNVYSAFICNSPKLLEPTHRSFNNSMVKYMVHLTMEYFSAIKRNRL